MFFGHAKGEFGGIPNAEAIRIHSSGCIRAEPNVDDTQMERAMKLADRRDMSQGTNLNHIFCYLFLMEK